MIRVIIADDHEVYRDGLVLLLRKTSMIDIVAQANNGAQLLEQVQQMQPDVVLTDLRMPQVDGIEAIRRISGLWPDIKIIALSTFDNENLIIEALEGGALGYVIKNAQRGEIIDAIKTVHLGKPYYSLSTTPHFAKKISYSHFNPYPREDKQLFKEREIEIIKLICNEYTNREIAGMLLTNLRTVERIRIQILSKMNVKSTPGLVIYAIKKNTTDCCR